MKLLENTIHCQKPLRQFVLDLRWLDIVMLTNPLKWRTSNGSFFTQILLAIMLTINSYVKYLMLHVMRDADDISRVKTGKLHPDVLIC